MTRGVHGIRMLGAAVFGIILAAGASVILWLYPQVVAAQAESRAATVANERVSSEISELVARADDPTIVDRELRALRRQIPESADPASIVRTIEDAATGAGVAVVAISADSAPEPLPDAEDGAGAVVVRVPLEFTVTGPSLDSIALFVDLLREGPRLIRVTSVVAVLGSVAPEATVIAEAYVTEAE